MVGICEEYVCGNCIFFWVKWMDEWCVMFDDDFYVEWFEFGVNVVGECDMVEGCVVVIVKECGDFGCCWVEYGDCF